VLLTNAISFTPEPDCISWKHFKEVAKNEKCLNNIVDIANVHIDLGHFLCFQGP